MNIKKATPVLGLAFVLPFAAIPQAAHAQVTVNTPSAVVFLMPATPNGGGAGQYTFTGSIVNVSTKPLFLNGDGFTPVGTTTIKPAWLTFDDSPFYNNAPTSLNALGSSGSSFTGGLFNMTIAPNAVPGTYSFTYDILGGTDGLTSSVLTSTDPFTITIAAAPEPSSMTQIGLGAVFMAGLYGFACLRARRRI